jgi:hypothetical protein
MQSSLSQAQDWRRPFWLALLIVSSVAFTLRFECAAPFAAFAAATALTLSRKDAVLLMLGVWLANQFTGFIFMGYPLDANTIAWGAALGATALISMLAARAVATRLSNSSPVLSITLAFMVAFAAYEASGYAFSMVLGGVENYTLAIQSIILLLNVGALIGLFALNYIGSTLQLMPAYNSRMLKA